MSASADDRGRYLALGFGTTVAMWVAAYICRMPGIGLPGPVLLLVLVAGLFGGGRVAARLTGDGAGAGLRAAGLASILNLLIIGSVIGGRAEGAVPSAMIWVPGSLVLGSLIGAAGGLSVRSRPPERLPDWTAALAKIAAVATFLLLIAGGIVTSAEAGLAVVDWPNSFGYNMFLYPLSKMSGGVFYEHTHRLLGSLVGLTTLVLFVHLLRVDRRGWLKSLGGLALVLVVVQGILGGLRVTGNFTMSTSETDMAPSIMLAATHGVLGQLFFATMTAIAVFTSTTWKESGAPSPHPNAGGDRRLSVIIGIAVIIQIVLGATQRHLSSGLLLHILGATIVLMLAIYSGMRASNLYEKVAAVRQAGIAVVAVTGLQFVIGFLALFAIGIERDPGPPEPTAVFVATLHQAIGAILLASVVMLIAWVHRFIVPADT